jgi:type I restriction enzyme S subunit
MSDTNGLPKGWCWANLAQLGEFINGDRGKNYPSAGGFVPTGIPFINAGHLRNGAIDFSNMNFITEDRFNILGSGKVKPDDILYCLRGSLGKTAIVTNVAQGAIASSLVIIRPFAQNSTKYIYYFLVSHLGKGEIALYDNGSAQPNLSAKNVKSFRLPLAPMNEQLRLIAKIEELFSDLDAGVAALKRIRANLKRYRAAVLKAAVEGRLTEQWRAKHPNTESATKLLERILAERRKKWEKDQLAKFTAADKMAPKGWREKYVEPTGPDTSNLPELPKGWCWASFETLMSESLRNGHSAKASGDGTGIRTLTLTAVTLGDFSEKNTKLTIAKPEAIEDLWLEPGDFLIERSNTPELVGTARLYRGPAGFAIFPDLLIRVRVFPSVVKGFVDAVLQSSFTRRYFQWRAKGLAGSMPKIDQGTILGLPVPVAPFAEQGVIGQEVERLLSIIEEAESQVQANLKRSARLRQSILKRAFEGRLVPQDPTDEPADKLLERIRQERTATNGSVAPRTRRGRAIRHAES